MRGKRKCNEGTKCTKWTMWKSVSKLYGQCCLPLSSLGSPRNVSGWFPNRQTRDSAAPSNLEPPWRKAEDSLRSDLPSTYASGDVCLPEKQIKPFQETISWVRVEKTRVLQARCQPILRVSHAQASVPSEFWVRAGPSCQSSQTERVHQSVETLLEALASKLQQTTTAQLP